MNQSFLIGLAAVAVAVIAWGIQLPIAKDAFVIVDPYHLTAIRYLVAALFLATLIAFREGKPAFDTGGHGLHLTFIGIIGMCASPVLVFIGMEMSRAEHAVIIVALQPTIAALILWVAGKQRPQLLTVGCIAVALLGVILVVTKGEFEFSGNKRALIGNIIIFLGALAWVLYSLGIARYNSFSAWRITILTMIPGALATILVTLIMVKLGKIHVPSGTDLLTVGWEIAYLTFIGVVAAMLAWNYGLRRIGPQNATLLINLMPVTAFTFRAWQGVRFTSIELFGVALVVIALVVNNLAQRRLVVAK